MKEPAVTKPVTNSVRRVKNLSVNIIKKKTKTATRNKTKASWTNNIPIVGIKDFTPSDRSGDDDINAPQSTMASISNYIFSSKNSKTKPKPEKETKLLQLSLDLGKDDLEAVEVIPNEKLATKTKSPKPEIDKEKYKTYYGATPGKPTRQKKVKSSSIGGEIKLTPKLRQYMDMQKRVKKAIKSKVKEQSSPNQKSTGSIRIAINLDSDGFDDPRNSELPYLKQQCASVASSKDNFSSKRKSTSSKTTKVSVTASHKKEKKKTKKELETEALVDGRFLTLRYHFPQKFHFAH